MKFSYWNETIEAFPDLPNPASPESNSGTLDLGGYPLFRIRADSELEPVIVSGMQSKVLSYILSKKGHRKCRN